ncbi:MAG: hypothetical protein ACOY94_08220 [Bacillota bacterium]
MRTAYDLERAVLALKQAGFSGADFRWINLQPEPGAQEPKGFLAFLRRGGFLGDTQYRSDNASLMDGTAAGATIAALLGIVYGSVLRMGPITGGTIGVLVGGLVGWLLDQWIQEKRSRNSLAQRLAQYGCLVLVTCKDEHRIVEAEKALRQAQAVLTGASES